MSNERIDIRKHGAREEDAGEGLRLSLLEAGDTAARYVKTGCKECWPELLYLSALSALMTAWLLCVLWP